MLAARPAPENCNPLLPPAVAAAVGLLGEAAGHPGDNWPGVLGSLLLGLPASAVPPEAAATADRAVAGWLTTARPAAHLGAYGDGLTARHLGVLAACRVRPQLARLAAASRRVLAGHCSAPGVWRTDGIGWEDYDLVTGPAGVLLALSADPGATPADRAPALDQLVTLCSGPGLERLRLRTGAEPGRSPWNLGRINLGVAHGIAGVALALCATAGRQDLRPGDRAALAAIADRLTAEVFRDAHGVLTWPAVAREEPGAEPGTEAVAPVIRQAWCYGTPGVAWALWEAGRILGDPASCATAEAAFTSFVDAGCPNLNPSLWEGLAVCHGDAGLLLLCDAFARHAGLAAAGAARDLIQARLHRRLPDMRDRAGSHQALLTGAPGTLAALLTVAGADRGWLAQIGLR
ncbi:lanthionine synthetase LanC family protein [Actinoplanes sp. NPDC023801]|uniref:lanthionine synthetase LanC family protein n=1 Tax=Actinoplanes sp. NPDC023801 TaxID=3154595 RepID=UPI0033D32F5A